jgi:hypothetical protein
MYLLVAGMQTTLIWIIPVALAASAMVLFQRKLTT